MTDSVLTLWGMSLLFPAFAKQLLVAMLFGLLIGFERAWHRKVASLRTFAFMCTGSCLFTIVSTIAASGQHEDGTRIAAGIVTGIGFIGGGVIFKSTDRIEGITTGAMIFIASAIGMACGFNHIELATWGFLTYVAIHLISIFCYRTIDLVRGVPKVEQKAPKTK